MNKEQRLKKLFNELDVSQKDFAKAVGVSQQMISDIFNNKKKVGEKIVMGVLENYNVNPLWLIKGEGEMFTNNQKLTIVSEPENEGHKKTASVDEEAVVEYLVKNTDNLMKNHTFKLWYNYVKERAKNEFLSELRSSV